MGVMVICGWCHAAYHFKIAATADPNPKWTKSTKDDVAAARASNTAAGGTETHGCCPDCFPGAMAAAKDAAAKKREEFAKKKTKPE